MKRFHLHIVVDDLGQSIEFYSRLFGQQPDKQKDNYAKWMLEDPRLNFAISSQGLETGINHLGMQVDTAEELAALKTFADAASEGNTRVQSETACCYAKSDKHWTVDPQGIAWEHFLTMEDSEIFGEGTQPQAEACCIPDASKKNETRCCAG